VEATGDRQLFNPLILRKLGLPLGGQVPKMPLCRVGGIKTVPIF